MYFHDDVKQVTIYTDACQVKHGSTIAPITTLENEEENYGMVGDNQIHWIVNAKDKTAYSLNRMAMLEQKKAKGLLYVGVDYDSVFQPFNNETVFDNYGVVIEDAEGNCIFKKSVFTEEKQPYELSEEQFFATVGQKNSGYQFIKRESKASGWKIWIYKPDRLIISSVQPILIIAAAAILVSLMAAIACIRIISEFITKRISKLQKKMRNLETGNLGMEIENDSTDEIGDLINGYNSMTKRLDATINEVYRSKIKEKEYEMRALQAQINPHFLYNSFYHLYRMAKMEDTDGIAEMSLKLSSYYRYITRSAQPVVTLAMEYQNIVDYTEIQTIRFGDRITVQLQPLPEPYRELAVPRFILQPLFENAYNHGVEKMENGLIQLRFKMEPEFLNIYVENNGSCPDAELEKLTQYLNSTDRKAECTALKNVKLRMQMQGGDLQVSHGTLGGFGVSLRLPLHPAHSLNTEQQNGQPQKEETNHADTVACG